MARVTALRWAWRDLRRSGRGLWLLALCLALGTAALAAIGSLSASVLAALDGQGRQALGGDLALSVSQRRASVDELAAFAGAGRVSETVRMRAMVDGGHGAALADLKAVDARWPLVGQAGIADARGDWRDGGVLLAPALAARLGVRAGDPLRVGSARLRVAGLLADEPDRLGEGFRLGPPAIVSLSTLDRTGLVQPGSLFDARYVIVMPAGRDPGRTGAALVRRFPSAGWTAKTPAEATATLRRGIDQLGQFLLLVGLAALVIAAIGVASGVGAFLAAKTRTVAILKVQGARSGEIGAMLLAEVALVAVAAVAAGVAIGAAAPPLAARWLADALPVPPEPGLYPRPLLLAAALAGLAGLAAVVPALARARAVPAAALLRDGTAAGRIGAGAALAVAALLAALAALAVLGASDRRLALGFLGATAAALLLLGLLGAGLRRGLARLPRPRGPLARLALANLHRPGAQTDRLVVALGLGFALFVALAVIDTSLSAEMQGAAPAKAPRFFAIDLQPEDEGRFRAAVAAASPGARIEAVPSLRGSVVALKGRRVADMGALPERAWILRGDRTLTWSATLPPRNQVVAGHWWPAGYRGPPLVSIGADNAAALGLHVGDTITVAVLGVEVPARIAALRRIDWGGLGLNFAIIFSPGYIEEAPHALLASVYSAPSRDGAVAARVAAALPAVTLVRVGDILGQIGALVGQLALAVRAAAAATVAAGIAVLVGAVAASARGRRRDAVLLKLMGATRGQLLGVQVIEYALLSALLAAVALGLGAGAGWYVVVHVFKLPFAPSWRAVAATLAAASAVTLAVGVLGSLPALGVRPAAALRDEG